VFMSGEGTERTYIIERREAPTPVFADLANTRRRPSSTDRALSLATVTTPTAIATRFRIHLFAADGEGNIMIASLRYCDSFVKIEGPWSFGERHLILDWIGTRTSTP
jgi:hypothetical protein